MEKPFIVMADIHGNLEALNAVLEDITDQAIPILCAGDVVGYGPDPMACIKRVREREIMSVLGNHDAAACGRMGTEYFNQHAARAAEWTGKRLSEGDIGYLENLSEHYFGSWVEMVHGTPANPLRQYLRHVGDAKQAVRDLEKRFLVVGHTHIPALYHGASADEIEAIPVEEGRAVSFSREHFTIVNPGSVGQPRDGDPRASYLRINPQSEELEWIRVTYEIERTQQKIRKADLSDYLADRLSYGK